MAKRKSRFDKRYFVDKYGRVWRRYAIPKSVALENGLNWEKLEQENRDAIARIKRQERKDREKAWRKTQAKREKAHREWEERPCIIYTPMGNKR